MRNLKKQKIKMRVAAFLISGLFFISFSQTVNAAQESMAESVETDSLIDEAMSKDQADEIFRFIIQKISEGGLDSEEAITFQIFLADEEKDRIVQIVDQVNTWGLDAQGLAEKAEELYDEYGMELLEHPEKAAAEVVKSSIGSSLKGIGDFFVGIGKGIKDFFCNSVKSFFDGF